MLLKKDISKEQKNKLNSLVQISIKYFILTSVASFSSLLFITIVVIGFVLVAPLDYITNMVCLMLMTPYYNRGQYYEKICCLTIKCGNYCLGYCYRYTRDKMRSGESNVNNDMKEICATVTNIQPNIVMADSNTIRIEKEKTAPNAEGC